MAEKVLKPTAKNDGKIFDVAKPDKIAAVATARPVIITNRPLIHDPVLSGAITPNDVVSQPPAGKVKLGPLDETKDSPTMAHQLAPEGPTSIADIKDVNERDPVSVSTVPTEETSKASHEAAQLETAVRKQEALDKLVEDKTFYLPINAVERRRSKLVGLFGLLLICLLALILIDLLLDLGAVHIPGIKPLTHFFST